MQRFSKTALFLPSYLNVNNSTVGTDMREFLLQPTSFGPNSADKKSHSLPNLHGTTRYPLYSVNLHETPFDGL